MRRRNASCLHLRLFWRDEMAMLNHILSSSRRRHVLCRLSIHVIVTVDDRCRWLRSHGTEYMLLVPVCQSIHTVSKYIRCCTAGSRGPTNPNESFTCSSALMQIFLETYLLSYKCTRNGPHNLNENCKKVNKVSPPSIIIDSLEFSSFKFSNKN